VFQTEILNRVRELIRPLLAGRGVELVELTCHPGGGRLTLRCLVDTARGITLDEVSGLSRSIGAVLEEHDAIPDRYLLEVSSPGLDRPLKTTADFERVIGRRVKVTTSAPRRVAAFPLTPASAPAADRQERRGEVLGVNEEAVMLRLDSGEKLPIPFSQIHHAVQEIKI
jgi:ribosome maturation factor RimP